MQDEQAASRAPIDEDENMDDDDDDAMSNDNGTFESYTFRMAPAIDSN